MLIKLFNWFVKITGYLIQRIIFNTAVYYEDKQVQNRNIKGKAIIISNHTSVFDYACYLFVFFSRTCRFLMAEILFNKKPLGLFLKMLGGIKVDRNSHNFSFLNKCEDILEKGGVIGVFPESRIPLPNEETPLEFKPSAVYLALSSNTKIIPVYTNGSYFTKERARVIIGVPIDVNDYYSNDKSEKENIALINDMLRNKIIDLKRQIDEQK